MALTQLNGYLYDDEANDFITYEGDGNPVPVTDQDGVQAAVDLYANDDALETESPDVANARYDGEKERFLADPQYQDIKPELFDPFVAGASTWEQAAESYRHFAGEFQGGQSPAGELAPAGPAEHESLNAAIDGMFSDAGIGGQR